jgi:hypothetical protein
MTDISGIQKNSEVPHGGKSIFFSSEGTFRRLERVVAIRGLKELARRHDHAQEHRFPGSIPLGILIFAGTLMPTFSAQLHGTQPAQPKL